MRYNTNMKKTITAIAMLAGAVTAYSQGQLNMYDYGSFSIQVFNISSGANVPVTYGGFSTMEVQGNTENDTSPSSTTYSGAVLGSGYSIELLAAPGGGDALSSLLPVSGTIVSSWDSGFGGGYWNTSVLASIPNTTTIATVAIAAWNNAGGTLNTLAAAQAAGDPWGISDTSTTSSLGFGTVQPPALPAGLTSFSLGATPEPSTIALGLVGASAFLMRLRRKQ
jgi:hypothetical protein